MPLDPDCRAAWTNPRIVVTLLLVFLSGSVVGAVALTTLRPMPSAQAQNPTSQVDWDGAGKNLVGELTTELELDPDQQKRLQRTLDDFFLYYHSLQDQMEEVRASGKLKILEVLRPEQKKKFEQWLAARAQ